MNGSQSTIRETCKACGETHVSTVYGISNSVNYAVAIDTCIHCKAREEALQLAREANERMARGGEQ